MFKQKFNELVFSECSKTLIKIDMECLVGNADRIVILGTGVFYKIENLLNHITAKNKLTKIVLYTKRDNIEALKGKYQQVEFVNWEEKFDGIFFENNDLSRHNPDKVIFLARSEMDLRDNLILSNLNNIKHNNKIKIISSTAKEELFEYIDIDYYLEVLECFEKIIKN